MEISTYNLVLLFIVCLICALIIGFSILFVIDDRLSRVSVNLPQCPQPNIIIRTDDNLFLKANLTPIKNSQQIENFHETTIKSRPLLSNGYITNTQYPNDTTRNVLITKNDNMKNNKLYEQYKMSGGNTIQHIKTDYKMYDNYNNIRGTNLSQTVFGTHADIDQIGSIPVNDYRGNPRAIHSK
jgi:hypothetical protein